MRFAMPQRSFAMLSMVMVIIYKILKIASEGRMYDCSVYIIPQGCLEAKNESRTRNAV